MAYYMKYKGFEQGLLYQIKICIYSLFKNEIFYMGFTNAIDGILKFLIPIKE